MYGPKKLYKCFKFIPRTCTAPTIRCAGGTRIQSLPTDFEASTKP